MMYPGVWEGDPSNTGEITVVPAEVSQSRRFSSGVRLVNTRSDTVPHVLL